MERVLSAPVAAPKEFNRANENAHRNYIEGELADTYRKSQNLVVPYGKTLNFAGVNGELVTLGLNGSGQFTISIDGAAAFALASNAALTTLTGRVTTAEGEIDTAQAAIITNAAAITTVDGKLTASYGLTVDVNGRIASMKLLSNGTTSSVKFTASTFSIYDDSSSDVAPFEVSGGVVKIKTANIPNLNASIITAGSLDAARIAAASIDATKLSVSTLSAITANLGSITAGTISLTAGSYSRYDGAGIGASSDLLLWFGPSSTAVGSATKTNAIFALATDGKTYAQGVELQTMFVTPSPTNQQVSGSRVGAGSVTTSAASIGSVLGGNGTYTYAWTYVSGDTFTINSPTSSSTTGTASVTVGQTKTGYYKCTVTDTDTGRTASTTFRFLAIETT